MAQVLYTDTELLEGLAAGKREVVAALYRVYHMVLVRWITGRGGLEADAEDVFQEALIILYEKAQQPEFCLTCKLSTYLFAICKRLWYKKIEQKSKFSELREEEEDIDYGQDYDDDLEEHWERELQFEQMEKALEQLGEPCASLLRAFYMEKKSMQDIAAAFRYTNAENAKTQKYKCLSRLKKIFFANTLGADVS